MARYLCLLTLLLVALGPHSHSQDARIGEATDHTPQERKIDPRKPDTGRGSPAGQSLDPNQNRRSSPKPTPHLEDKDKGRLDHHSKGIGHVANDGTVKPDQYGVAVSQISKTNLGAKKPESAEKERDDDEAHDHDPCNDPKTPVSEKLKNCPVARPK